MEHGYQSSGDTLEIGGQILGRKGYSIWVTLNEGSDNGDQGEITRFKKWIDSGF